MTKGLFSNLQHVHSVDDAVSHLHEETTEATYILQDNTDKKMDEELTDATYLLHDNTDKANVAEDTGNSGMTSCDIITATMLLIVVLCSTISVCCAQALGGLIPEFELNMWRFLAHLLIISPVAIVRKISVLPSREDALWIGIISFMYILYNMFYFQSTIHLPLGTIAGMSRGLTLICVSMVTVTMFKECTLPITLSCGLCILGMVFISQPDFMFGDLINNLNKNHTLRSLCYKRSGDTKNEFLCNASTNNTSQTFNKHDNEVALNVGLGYIFILLSSCAMCTIYFARNKKVPNVHWVLINQWVGVCGFVVSFVFMLIFEDIILPGSVPCILLLCGHAIAASLSTTANQFVLQHVSPVIIALFTSLELVSLGIAQYTFMKNINPGKGNALEIIGMGTVLLCNLVGPMYQYVLQSL